MIPPGAHLPRFCQRKAEAEWTWLEAEDYIPYLLDYGNVCLNTRRIVQLRKLEFASDKSQWSQRLLTLYVTTVASRLGNLRRKKMEAGK